MEETHHNKTSKRGRSLWIACAAVALVLFLLLATVQVVLHGRFLQTLVSQYAPQFVEGSLQTGRIRGSILRNFPNLHLTVEGASLTYPHERFARYDTLGAQSRFRQAGQGPGVDTLLSFKQLNLSINLFRALRGQYHLHGIKLDGARIFAHQFDSTTASWNILPFLAGDADTTSAPMPDVTLRRIELTGKPLVIYTHAEDTLFGAVGIQRARFAGKLKLNDLKNRKIDLRIDNLFVGGRKGSDTLGFALQSLSVDENKGPVHAEATARAFLAPASSARMAIPLSLSTDIRFPEDNFSSISLRDISLQAAMLSLGGNADLRFCGDSTYIGADASLEACPVQEVTQFFGDRIPALKGLKTDAVVSLTASCQGYYVPATAQLPEFSANLEIPESAVDYDRFERAGRLAADISMESNPSGGITLNLSELVADLQGIVIEGSGDVPDLLAEDPVIRLDARARASLDTLATFLPDSLGIRASGDISAMLKGGIKLSQISLYKFSQSSLNGRITSDGLSVSERPHDIQAFLGPTRITLGPAGDSLKDLTALGRKLQAVQADIDTLNATYGPTTFIRGSRIRLFAQNAVSADSQEYGKEINPVIGQLSAQRLAMTGEDSLFVALQGTRNSFRYAGQKNETHTAPALSLTSRNQGLFLRQGSGRLGLRNAAFQVTARNTTFRKTQRRKAFLDSLQRVYPGVRRDSLLQRMFASRTRELPSFLKDEDFRKKDIDIRLSESMARYVRDWSLSGVLDIGSGMIISPHFPLKNRLSRVKGTFDNNTVHLDNLTIHSGESDLTATGKLSGLRRALTSRGILDLDLKLTSERLNANELLAAYDAGSKFVPSGQAAALEEGLSDEAYLSQVVTDTLDTAEATLSSLLVIPANLNARIHLQANEIDYSDLAVNWLASDIAIRQRCLQVTNTLATSNMGDIYFEGFYSTTSKEDIKAGFDLNMVDITADKVITLFPAVDSIIPMLKAFKGMLDCEMAATSDLDTEMNLVMPSIVGIMKIMGSDLAMEENEGLRKIAKTLMFKDQKIGRIEDMSVQGLIGNSTLEIFPFLLKVSRYTLAMSGLQNFDQSFNYHISVLKSPLPMRFGVDLTGNFDNWKYKIGKARYKSTRIPVFTAQIDTMQVNLVESIHNIFRKGVDVAVRQNEAMNDSIQLRKQALGYDTDAPLDSLSSREKKALEEYVGEAPDSVMSANPVLQERIDSLSAAPALNTSDVPVEAVESKMQQRLDERAARREQRRSQRKEKGCGLFRKKTTP